MDNFITILLGIAALATLLIQIYGVYTAYTKKWWLGVLAFLFPQFALIVGLAKLAKKEILA